ncbi:hypothetical protein FGO68_gene7160 [Halteria grandinella]|uniref:Uncharacterized protein n=1 Tax=Halteria grandinella TaxID=5974 RepID=A0A8J8NCG1_HALGN|nr:hypothetical protein FGO68_gene7160 [Halteria grandinella]
MLNHATSNISQDHSQLSMQIIYNHQTSKLPFQATAQVETENFSPHTIEEDETDHLNKKNNHYSERSSVSSQSDYIKSEISNSHHAPMLSPKSIHGGEEHLDKNNSDEDEKLSIYYGERDEKPNDSFRIHSEHNLTFDARDGHGATEGGNQYYSLLSKRENGSDRFNSQKKSSQQQSSIASPQVYEKRTFHSSINEINE